MRFNVKPVNCFLAVEKLVIAPMWIVEVEKSGIESITSKLVA
jgi:hypothetical protein